MIKRTVIDTSKIAAELAKSAAKSTAKPAAKTASALKKSAQMTAGAARGLAQFGVENLPEMSDDVSPQAFMEDMMKVIQSAALAFLAFAPGIKVFSGRFLPGKFANIQRNVVRNAAKNLGIDVLGGQRQGQKQGFTFRIPQGLAPKPNLKGR